MGRSIHKLNAKKIERLAEPGWHGDGGGLWLRIAADGSKRWIFVWKRHEKRREMGLGSFSTFSLDDARSMAMAARQLVTEGSDPIELRRETIEAEKSAEAAAKAAAIQATVPTFATFAKRYIAAHEDGWADPRSSRQWHSSIVNHAKALLERPVDQITADDLVNTLKPIWSKIAYTAGRLRVRIETILDAAKAEGHIKSPWENPARWKGNLAHRLPKRKRYVVDHYAAMPYEMLPDFFSSLRNRGGNAARALEFTIFCATRTNETLGMKLGEVDLTKGIWTIPAERMKMRVEHRIPLSQASIQIIKIIAENRKIKPGEYVFSGKRAGTHLSRMAMLMLMRRMGFGQFTVHGMRSTFRDYIGDMTQHAESVIEHSLAHQVGNSSERAYRRRDAFEKRKAVMADWADYVLSSEAKASVQLLA